MSKLSNLFKISPIILLLLMNQVVEGVFHFPEINQMEISSHGWDYNYPNHTTDIDIIWRYSHSVELYINELQLDGQSGDFILISDLPLTFEDSFVEWNNSQQVPTFLPDSIVTSHGILLSWELEEGTKFHVLSKHGTFVYFHAEGNLNTRGSFPYQGFNITVNDLDEMRTPPPTTTTEGTKPPPSPDVEIYTSKYLRNPPFEFRDQKDAFKTALATIATDYCNEQDDCRDFLTSDFNIDNVNIPSDHGLRMCDMSWDTYESCVEVTFAITKEEEIGGYLLPKWRLDEMWTKYGSRLEGFGFIPYDDHPIFRGNIDTWIWIAGFLGIILFLMIPMVIFWIVHEIGDRHVPSAIDTDEMDKPDNDGFTSNNLWADLSNPIRPMLAKLIKRQSEDTKYLEVSNSDNNAQNTMSEKSSVTSTYNKSPKTTTNVLFQEHDVTFEYDNQGYDQKDINDENEDENDEGEIVLYGHGRDFMDIADEDFPPEDRFLTMDRGDRSQFEEHSEI